MPVSSDIYAQIQAPQSPNLLAQFAQAAQVQGVQQQNKLAQLQMQEYERARVQDEAERGVYKQFGPDVSANTQLLYGAGLGKQAVAYGKSAADLKKSTTEADAASFGLQRDKLSAVSNIISSAKDQNSYTQGIQQLQAMGIDTSNIPQQFDPNYVASAGQQALTAVQRLDAELKSRGFDVTMRGQDIGRQNSIDTNATSRANNAASVGATIRGQNMTDSRQRESNQNGRVPTGYRQLGDGSLEFIPGGPADPASAKKASPTEFQGKSAIFGARAQESNRILNDLQGTYSPSAINAKQSLGGVWGIGGALESGANSMLPANTQRAEQARRDFVNAVLRQESGAAIGKDEFDNASRQYFPQPGDSAAVIKQKADNRALQIQGLLGNAGNAPIPSRPKASQGGSTGGWAIEEVK